MNPNRSDIRLALPSKGRLAERSLEFLRAAGLQVYKPNPRQFEASIPSMPGLFVLFQRAGDIPISVRDGSVDFGITGMDMTAERLEDPSPVMTLLPELGFGHCTLNVIVPEGWQVEHTRDLVERQAANGNRLRIATKYPRLSRQFFASRGLADFELIQAEGTLEAAPAIGYADVIVDLVSTGTTLRDNRLRKLADGVILESQACLIANRHALQKRPRVLDMARQLLDFLVAHLRAIDNLAVFANMRGDSPQAIADLLFQQPAIRGLQGPTISPILSPDGGSWYAVNIVVRRDQLNQAINEIRAVGGSGVVVTPISYIFEEEPEAYRAMLDALRE